MSLVKIQPAGEALELGKGNEVPLWQVRVSLTLIVICHEMKLKDLNYVIT